MYDRFFGVNRIFIRQLKHHFISLRKFTFYMGSYGGKSSVLIIKNSGLIPRVLLVEKFKKYCAIELCNALAAK